MLSMYHSLLGITILHHMISAYIIFIYYSQKHFGKEESVKFQTNFAVEKNNLNVLSQSNPADISNEFVDSIINYIFN